MTFCDWFLPSKDELNKVWVNLVSGTDENSVVYDPVGDFIGMDYWSSTEVGSINAWAIGFDTGFHNSTNEKDAILAVCPCRSFISTTVYNLRDIGPAGGLIFYIIPDITHPEYFETAPLSSFMYTYWSDVFDVEIGLTAQETVIGAGVGNTLEIINQVGHTYGAAKYCDDLCTGNTTTTTLVPTTTLFVTTQVPLMRGITISHKLPNRITSTDLVPSVLFSVNPGLGGCYEFLDMFIRAAYKPSSLLLSTNKNFTDPATVPGSKIDAYNPGWFYIHRFPKTIGGQVLKGKVLFVKILFDDQDLFYDIKLTKIGYREIIGG